MTHKHRIPAAVLVGRGCCGSAKWAAARALVLLYFSWISPVASWAHAFPVRSDPKVGATVNSSPETIRIWFDCDLEPASSKVVVRNAENKIVDKNDSKVDASNPKLLKVSVEKLPPGRYRVIWRVVDREEGHHSNGDFTFRVK